jgi:hypothetical protein
MGTDIHAPSGIRTLDISYFKPRGHCYQKFLGTFTFKFEFGSIGHYQQQKEIRTVSLNTRTAQTPN